jgi:hypothetical protein
MKRKAIAFVLVIVIPLTVASWIVYNQTVNQVEKQTYDVKITDFKWTSNWGPGPVGVSWGGSFNVTLHNMGNMDVEGLVVEVKQLANNSELGSETYFDGYNTNVTFGLHAGEIRELEGTFLTSLVVLDKVQGELTYKVVCMLNSTILDELTLPSN